MIADALLLADSHLKFTEKVLDPSEFWKVGEGRIRPESLKRKESLKASPLVISSTSMSGCCVVQLS